ncbi:5529_t:CDS:2, partial [Acaulospora colombiana]
MEQREEADKVNDFGRDPIGESKEEKRYNRDLKAMLVQKRDDASRAPDIGERNSQNKEKKRPTLNDLTRFTMNIRASNPVTPCKTSCERQRNNSSLPATSNDHAAIWNTK